MTLGELKRIEANPSAADVPALTAYIRQLIVKLGDSNSEVRDLQAELDKANTSVAVLADRLDYLGGGNQ